jgi:metal-responsive CopG/Arc/MetJ family transcriptional regulator
MNLDGVKKVKRSRLCVRVSEEVLKKLNDLCESKCLDKSKLVEKILDTYLNGVK